MSNSFNRGRIDTSSSSYKRHRIEWVCCSCGCICDGPRASPTDLPSCSTCEHAQCSTCFVKGPSNDCRPAAQEEEMMNANKFHGEPRAAQSHHGTLDTVPDYSDDDADRAVVGNSRFDMIGPGRRAPVFPFRSTADSHATHGTSATAADDGDDSSASDSSGGFVKSLKKYKDRKLNESIRQSNESFHHTGASQATTRSTKEPTNFTSTCNQTMPCASPVLPEIDASPITPGKLTTPAAGSNTKAAMIIDSQDDVVSIISPPTESRRAAHAFKSANAAMLDVDEALALQLGAQEEEDAAEVINDGSSTDSEVSEGDSGDDNGAFKSASAYKRACPPHQDCDSTDSDDVPLRDIPIGSQGRPSIFDEDTDIDLSSDEESVPAADMYDESFVGGEDYEDYASVHSGDSADGGAAPRAPSVDPIDFVDLIDDPMPTPTAAMAQPGTATEVQGASDSHVTPAAECDPKLPFFRSVALLNMQRLMGKEQVYINYSEQFKGACLPVKQGFGPKTKGGSASDPQNKKLVEQREESRLKRRAERAKERKLAWVQKAVEMLQEEGLISSSGPAARKASTKPESSKAPKSKKSRPTLDDDDTHEARAAPRRAPSAAPAAGFVSAKSLSHEYRTVSSGDPKIGFDIISTARPKPAGSGLPLQPSSHVRSNYDASRGYDGGASSAGSMVPPRQSNLRAMSLPVPKKAPSTSGMAASSADTERPWIARVAIQSSAPQLNIAPVPSRPAGPMGLSALVSSKEFKKPRPAVQANFDYDFA